MEISQRSLIVRTDFEFAAVFTKGIWNTSEHIVDHELLILVQLHSFRLDLGVRYWKLGTVERAPLNVTQA